MIGRLNRALALSPLLLFMACQQPPDVSGEIEDYARLINDVRFLSCNCPQDLGYQTKAECDEALGIVDDADITCLNEKIEGHEDAGKDYLDCVNATYRDYVDCLEANVSCEAGAIDSCAQEHSQALEACPQLPDGVHQAFGACTV